MENNNKKEITLEDLAELIKSTEKSLSAKIETSAEELAVMTQKHFLTLEADMKEIKTDVEVLKSDLGVVKNDVGEIKANMNKKVDIFKHNELTYRVEKLEDKAGIMRMKIATA